MNDRLPMTNEAVLRACFNTVAADVRRRRFGQLSSGNPPPHVGGYGVLKHVLSARLLKPLNWRRFAAIGGPVWRLNAEFKRNGCDIAAMPVYQGVRGAEAF